MVATAGPDQAAARGGGSRRAIRGRRAVGVGLAVLALAVAGCTRDDADPGPASAAATAGTEAPMTPAQARADKGPNYANGCYGDREATAVPEAEDCVVGDPDGPTVVLYGDSHAEQWFPAMARLAKSEGWRLVPLAKMACPPGGALVRNAHWDRPYAECTQWRDSALQRIRAEDPDLVVVSTRADYYRVVQGGTVLSRADSADPLGHALAAELAGFAKQGAQVALIRDTPAPGFHVPDCLEGSQAADCAFVLADALVDDRAQRAAATSSGATVVDLTAQVCGAPETCPVVRDGLITYRDDDHLAATFAATLSSALAEGLRPVAPG